MDVSPPRWGGWQDRCAPIGPRAADEGHAHGARPGPAPGRGAARGVVVVTADPPLRTPPEARRLQAAGAGSRGGTGRPPTGVTHARGKALTQHWGPRCAASPMTSGPPPISQGSTPARLWPTRTQGLV